MARPESDFWDRDGLLKLEGSIPGYLAPPSPCPAPWALLSGLRVFDDLVVCICWEFEWIGTEHCGEYPVVNCLGRYQESWVLGKWSIIYIIILIKTMMIKKVGNIFARGPMSNISSFNEYSHFQTWVIFSPRGVSRWPQMPCSNSPSWSCHCSRPVFLEARAWG